MITMLELPPTPHWFATAPCKGHTDVYFGPPQEHSSARETREAQAIAICNPCDAIDECRDHARTHRESGVWGGENDITRAVAGYRPASNASNVRRAIDRADNRGA